MGEKEILSKSNKFSWIWTSFETIWNENEEKEIKVKAPITAKKNKQHQTTNCNISVTSAAADLNFLLCIDLV